MANNRKTQKSTDKNKSQKNGQTTAGGRGHKKYSEFKFQPHDTVKKNGYMFDKIQEAAILKLQTNLEYVRYVVKSLRNTIKRGQKSLR